MNGIRKIAVAVLAACLAGGALVAPAGAGKTQTPGTRTYYLVQGDGNCDVALGLTPTSTSQAQCLDAGAGAVNETYTTYNGEECDPDASGNTERCVLEPWIARGGLPFRLDGTRAVSGTIYVSSVQPHGDVPAAAGAGPATLHVSARAVVDGSPVVLGRFTADYVVTPAQHVYEVPFEIELDAALDGGTVTELALDVWNSGLTAGHGVYVPDESKVVVPIRRGR